MERLDYRFSSNQLILRIQLSVPFLLFKLRETERQHWQLNFVLTHRADTTQAIKNFSHAVHFVHYPWGDNSKERSLSFTSISAIYFYVNLDYKYCHQIIILSFYYCVLSTFPIYHILMGIFLSRYDWLLFTSIQDPQKYNENK